MCVCVSVCVLVTRMGAQVRMIAARIAAWRDGDVNSRAVFAIGRSGTTMLR